MRKNVSGQIVSASLVSRTDGSAVTTGTTTVYVTGDGGTQASGGGTVTHEGNGEWSYAPTQAETNYTHIAFTFTNTSAVGQTLNVYTVGQDFTAAQLNANVTQISGDSVAADNLEAATDGTGYNVGNGSVVAASVTAEVTANVTAISGDTAAADNLEAAADGTGYNLGGGAVVAASVTGNVGGTVNGFTAVALADFFDTNSGTTYASAVAGSVVKEIVDNASGGGGSITIRPVKNSAFNGFMFPMFDSTTKAPKTGLTVSATRAIDGGSFASCTNSPTEIGGGVYAVNLSASDLNGDKIMFRFTASDADVQLVEIFTQG